MRILLVTICLAAATASAVVWRHDVPPAAALALGAKFPAVGRVRPDGSATLIAPTWVLTAAHVGAIIKADSTVEFEGKRYAVKRVVMHPKGIADPARPNQPPEVDLALLELATPVTGIAPLALHRAQDEMGKPLAIVGYGDFAAAGAPLVLTDGQRRAVMNAVADAGPKRLFFPFDAPPAGEPLEGMGAPGDSGGPALIEVGAVWQVAGVSSGSQGEPGAYGSTDIYVRVSSYLDWIDATLGAHR
jgi:Trypsin